jgi:arginine exporter protein ArgO
MDPTVAPPSPFLVFVQGLALSFGLVVAIGVQNAFVLRLALRRARQSHRLARSAAAASLAWFSLLGFGARWLAPWLARSRAWQVLQFTFEPAVSRFWPFALGK